MGCADSMRTATHHQVRLKGRVVDYRVVRSKTAKKLRLRVGLDGIEVVQPHGRDGQNITAFLDKNGAWVLGQLQRVARLRKVRRPAQSSAGKILFRGESTTVRIEATKARNRGNRIDFVDGEIVVRHGEASRTPVERSLENWLRKQARAEIETQLAALAPSLRARARRVYVMGQRTKWGNCSGRKNLSFNWRLILAPEFVIRYLVTHEAVHLAVPDHSAKFWLAVQSLCSETEKAKQWLNRYGTQLTRPLDFGSALKEPQRLAARLPGRVH